MRITIILAVISLYSAIYLSSCDLTFAQSTPSAKTNLGWERLATDPGALDVGKSLIAPNSPLYFLKNLRERLEIKTASDEKVKATRELEFSIRRIREVKSLIKSGKEDLIPATLEKYKEHLKNSRSWLRTVGAGPMLEAGNGVARHLFVLQSLYLETTTKEAKRGLLGASKEAFSYNKKLVEELSVGEQQALIKQIALRQASFCQFLERLADDTLWNQTERAVLKEEVISCQEYIDKYLKDELEDLEKKRL